MAPPAHRLPHLRLLLLLAAALCCGAARAHAPDWRNLSAAVRTSGGCPPARTLTFGCHDARRITRTCVVGGAREVAPLSSAVLGTIDDARSSDACTTAFYGANWPSAGVDASGLHIARVLAFDNGITSLNLSNNLLEDFRLPLEVYKANLNKSTFSGVVRLQSLNLAGNPIKSFESIVPPSPILSLNVSSIPMQKLHANSSIFSALKSLDASNMSLTSVDVYGLATLEGLLLPFNNLASFSDIVIPETLYTLDVSGNKLTNWTSFVPPQKLSVLLASDNNITEIRLVNFSRADKLTAIDFSFNQLSSFSGILWHHSLVDLDLRGNPITSFEIQQSDLSVFANLAEFRVDAFESQNCGGRLEPVKGHAAAKVCVLEDEVFLEKYGFSTSDDGLLSTILIAATVVASVLLVVIGLVCWRRFLRRKNELNVELTRDEVLNEAMWLDDKTLAMLRLEPADVKIEQRLAKGKLTAVFLARMDDGRCVAVKKIRVEKARDAHAFASLLDEVRVRSTLEHPKVVQFIGYCWGSSLVDLAIVSEFMANGNLEALLKKQQRASASGSWTWTSSNSEVPAKLLLAGNVAEALVYLHTLAEPEVHGDVRARNVLLSDAWEAKLAGFGSRRKPDSSATKSASSSADAVSWTAPEILKQEPHDERADIYAFGALLAELDVCADPLAKSGLPRAQVAVAVAAGELRPRIRAGNDVPKELVELVAACLSLSPDSRPAAVKLHYEIMQLQRASMVVRTTV